MSASIDLVAGEASGDYLGARLLHSLKEHLPDLKARGIGGARMAQEGMQSLFAMDRLAVMGLFEPLRRLPELLLMRRRLGQELLRSPPDVFVGIDAPDFNLTLEKRLRRSGVPVVHYVSPSVWAWRRGRMRHIVQAVDAMLCLLPFEVDVYRQAGIPARCTGHPLAWEVPLEPDADARKTVRDELSVPQDAPLVAVLPGSRVSEVAYNLPTMLAAMELIQKRHPKVLFAIPPASAERRQQIESLLPEATSALSPAIQLVTGGAGRALAGADAALVVMGTATLETMLHRIPMVTTYRTGGLNLWLVKRLGYIDSYSLPNLLAGRKLVPEILQSQATGESLADAVCTLLENDQQPLREEFARLHASVRGEGPTVAAEVVAEQAGWQWP